MIARRLALLVTLVLGASSLASAQTGTLAPSPWFTGFDNNGLKLSGGKLCTYAAGTSTPQTTYTDVGLTTPNTNPIILDAAGRAVIYLSATSYKFVFRQPGTTTDCTTGTIIRTQDNIAAVPTSANSTAFLGTAGQTLTAGLAVYLSDGSGGKIAGQWYLADSSNTYSSNTPTIGIVPNTIASGSIGTITTAGLMSGLSALTIGATYYVSTSGAITTSAPTNARLVGQADTTTSIILSSNPPIQKATNTALTTPTLTSPTIATSIVGPFLTGCGFRLTLTSGTPVTTADVTGAASVFVTPFSNSGTAPGICAFYDGSTNWTALSAAEITVALGTLTSGLPYDIFCFNNSGTMACDSPVAWSSATARATALASQNGVPVKSGTTTRRYMGSFYTTSTTQTEDSFAKRNLFSQYNRVPKVMRVLETTDNWAYSVNTWRQARATATNQLEFMLGSADASVEASVIANVSDTALGTISYVSIGEDSTTTPDTGALTGDKPGLNSGSPGPALSQLRKYPAVGRHVWVWLEKTNATGVSTWYGDNGADGTASGIHGTIWQ